MNRDALAQFESYLRNVRGLSYNSIGSYIANCDRLSRHEGDLDAHFDNDGMMDLLDRLTYSTHDQREGLPSRHRVPINGDVRNGTATLKSAATLYMEFRMNRGERGNRRTSAAPRCRHPRQEELDRPEFRQAEPLCRTDMNRDVLAQFESYLRNVRGLSDNTIGSRIANCNRLERYEGDLDAHFDNDGMADLLDRLTYSTHDQHKGLPPRHRVPINGDVRNGTATLKSAATLYMEFRMNRGERGNRRTSAAPRCRHPRQEELDRPEFRQAEPLCRTDMNRDVLAQFESYLRNVRGLSDNTIGSRIANCNRLERYEGDLDAHFDNDGMADLLDRLTYSTHDQHKGLPPRHRVPINGDVRNGTATLKSAATLYMEFRMNRGDGNGEGERGSRRTGAAPYRRHPRQEELDRPEFRQAERLCRADMNRDVLTQLESYLRVVKGLSDDDVRSRVGLLARARLTYSTRSNPWAEAMELVAEPLRPVMRQWAAAGLPPPVVGFELTDARDKVLAEAELAWPTKRVAVLRDEQIEKAALFEQEGWRTYPYDVAERVIHSIVV